MFDRVLSAPYYVSIERQRGMTYPANTEVTDYTAQRLNLFRILRNDIISLNCKLRGHDIFPPKNEIETISLIITISLQ